MPQMFPLMWTSLFFSSLMSLIILLSILHFSVNTNFKNNTTTSLLQMPYTWKW